MVYNELSWSSLSKLQPERTLFSEKEVFLDKLKKLVALGESQNRMPLTRRRSTTFAGDNLGPEQMDEIYNYLEHNNIDVVPVIDDAMLADDSMLLDDLDDDYREDKDGEDIDLGRHRPSGRYRNRRSGPHVFKGDRYCAASFRG